MKKVDYGLGVHAFEEILTPEECQEIIKEFEAEPNKKFEDVQHNGLVGNYRQATTAYVSRLPHWAPRIKMLQDKIRQYIIAYNVEFGISKEILDTGFELVKYDPTKQCKPHRDGGQNQLLIFGAYIINLNTLSQGGELEFINQKISIKPKAGQLVIFPAGYTFVHRVAPSQLETRYAVVSFLRYPKGMM